MTIVDSNQGLQRALDVGGEILLSPGAYQLKAFDKAAPTVVAPLDPLRPPVLTHVELTRCSNITFRDLHFSSDGAGQSVVVRGQSSGIRFERFQARGTGTGYVGKDDPRPASFASFTNSTDCHVLSGDMSGYWHGVAFRNCGSCSVLDTNIHGMSGDGIRMARVTDMLIARNRIGGFYGSLYSRNHDDFIQIWATEGPSARVLIFSNDLDSRGMAATQSIFIRNESYAETKALHEDLVIVGNSVRNGHQHGILVEHSKGLIMRSNRLIWDKKAVMRNNSGPINSRPVYRAIGEVVDAVIEGNSED